MAILTYLRTPLRSCHNCTTLDPVYISIKYLPGIAHSEIQMGTGNEFLNFILIKK